MKKYLTFVFICLFAFGTFISGCDKSKEKATTADETRTVQEDEPETGESPEDADKISPEFTGIKSAMLLDENSIKLEWDSASDNKTAANEIHYLIYALKDKSQFDKANPLNVTVGTINKVLTVDEFNLDYGSTYYFRVNARDNAGNIDNNNKYMSLEIPEQTEEPVVDNDPPAFNSFDISYYLSERKDLVTLQWEAEEDVVYYIYKSSEQNSPDYEAEPFASTTDNFYRDLDVEENLAYTYGIVAKKESNDLKAGPVEKSVELIDNPPSAPELLNVYATGSRSARVEWKAANDDFDRLSELKYIVYLDTGFYEFAYMIIDGEAGKKFYSVKVPELAPDSFYIISVMAKDSRNQLSGVAGLGSVVTAKAVRHLYLANNNPHASGQHLLRIELDRNGMPMEEPEFILSNGNPEAEGSEEGANLGITNVALDGTEDWLALIYNNSDTSFLGMVPDTLLENQELPIVGIPMDYTMPCEKGKILRNRLSSDVYFLCGNEYVILKNPETGMQSMHLDDGDSDKRFTINVGGQTLYVISKGNALYQLKSDLSEIQKFSLDFTPVDIATTPLYSDTLFLLTETGKVMTTKVDRDDGKIILKGEEPVFNEMELVGSETPQYVNTMDISSLKVMNGRALLVIGRLKGFHAYSYDETNNSAKYIYSRDFGTGSSLTPNFAGDKWYITTKQELILAKTDEANNQILIEPIYKSNNYSDNFSDIAVSSE